MQGIVRKKLGRPIRSTVFTAMSDEALRATDMLGALAAGRAVSAGSIESFVAGLADGSVDDAQAGAFCMAVFCNGLNPDAAVALCMAMADSGERLHWGGPVADKHSTGGVGDKVSLILAPLLAAAGVRVPMLSGRSLGHTGGTLDKLESIAGLRTTLDRHQAEAQLESVGCFIAGASSALAPADARLYAVRDRTATVASIPLIASSIMSKKIAGGARALVLDVKWGIGSFNVTREMADELARTMVRLGIGAGVATSAAITGMHTPLGRAVGNACEVHESITVLQGGGDARLRQLVVELAERAATLAGVDVAPGHLDRLLDDGHAYELFERMCAAQGAAAPLTLAEPAEWLEVRAPFSGHGWWDALAVAHAASFLGATRGAPGAQVDPAASVWLDTRDGVFPVTAGDVIGRVGASNPALLERAAILLANAVVDSDTNPPPEGVADGRTVDAWITNDDVRR